MRDFDNSANELSALETNRESERERVRERASAREGRESRKREKTQLLSN